MIFVRKRNEPGKIKERRKYIRLATVFPVEFYILDEKGERLTPWLQGFTRNIGKGGICLQVNDLWQGFWERFNYRGAQIFLEINLPFRKEAICARAKTTWASQIQGKDYLQYFAGVDFSNIDKKEANLLFKYALAKRTLPIFVKGLIVTLTLASLFSFAKIKNLAKTNQRLVAEYVNLADKSASLEELLKEEKMSIASFKERQKDLENKIISKELQISHWKEQYEVLLAGKSKDQTHLAETQALEERIGALKTALVKLKEENSFLKIEEEKHKLSTLKIEKEFEDLESKKYEFSSKISKGLYNWIRNRQDLIQGLILSYEGDRNLERVCFTYDQALAAITFLLFDDRVRAEKILDFYLERVKSENAIYNAYYTKGEIFEYTQHCGPSAWIGLAALNYIKKTQNKKYLLIAERVADFLIEMMDKEGGIKGGPKENWYSTEHNLDAYAFFNLLSQISPEKKYLEAKEKIKNWISRYAYTSYGAVIKRGKGDATIATDTYAWSITAFGPKELAALEMNPEEILEFAIENCEVNTRFKYKDREVELRGFDFAKAKNIARGGVVSCEWTAQMILALEVMANYYQNKDEDKYKKYLNQAHFYFNELQKMLINSPSRVGRADPCFPYASQADVDTGHGWRTPKGDCTGSLASTAYFLIAYFGYNPLNGEFLNLSLRNIYEKRAKSIAAISH